jgi:SpoU rRNA methylase family enzyme
MPESIGNSSNYVVSVNSTGVYIDIDKIKGKSEIYPVVIVNELNNAIEVNMYPGKSYLIRNNPSNNHKKTISIIEEN